MPTFAYVARDASGGTRKDVLEATNEGDVARLLREQGLVVSNIRRVKGTSAAGNKDVIVQKKAAGGGFGRVKLADLSIFCRQFSTMIDAGVGLVRCLSVLGEQTPNVKLRRIIWDIQSEVEQGSTLSRAMAKHPRVFNNLFIGLVRAGEVGGVLEEALQRLAGFLEKDLELRRKVKSTMTYPTIVMVVAICIVVGLVTLILPKFMDLFKELGMKEEDMPSMTRMLMGFSNFLTAGFPMRQVIIAIVLVGAFIGWKAFTRTKVGRRIYDTIKLKAPVFGKLNHKIALARFARTLGTLMVSGVPILQALETVAGTVDNDIIGDAVLEARARIREGDRIGDPLQKSKMFPPMVVQMVSIGEESGALDQMLEKIAEFYEQEVDTALSSLTAAIEPVMIVFLGFSVGFIVISMFLPLVAIINNLSGEGGEGKKGGEE
jgi:type IV pilus assembly protein PilC